MSTDYEPMGSIIEKPETVVIETSPQTVVVGTSTSPFGVGISNTGRPASMMTFTDSIITVLSKYVDFSGRASRSEYWWAYLATVIVGFGFGIIDGILFGWEYEDPMWLSDIFNLVTFLPLLAAAVRRRTGTVVGIFLIRFIYLSHCVHCSLLLCFPTFLVGLTLFVGCLLFFVQFASNKATA